MFKLPNGAFLTAIDGRRCTAVPRTTTTTTYVTVISTAHSTASAAPVGGDDLFNDISTTIRNAFPTQRPRVSTGLRTTRTKPKPTSPVSTSSVVRTNSPPAFSSLPEFEFPGDDLPVFASFLPELPEFPETSEIVTPTKSEVAQETTTNESKESSTTSELRESSTTVTSVESTTTESAESTTTESQESSTTAQQETTTEATPTTTLQSAPLESAPAESSPVESAPLESSPSETTATATATATTTPETTTTPTSTPTPTPTATTPLDSTDIEFVSLLPTQTEDEEGGDEEATATTEAPAETTSAAETSAADAESSSEVDLDTGVLQIDTGEPTFTRTLVKTTKTDTDTDRATVTAIVGGGGVTKPAPSFATATLPGGSVTTTPVKSSSPGGDREGATNSGNTTKIDVIDQQSDTPSTPVLVGSIVGALAAITLICFLLWLWRKRVLKNRRSTLLTPLSLPPGGMVSRAGMYEIDRASLGPTPRSTKLAAAMSYNAKKFGHKFRLSTGSVGVDMNRGNSQFGTIPTHTRNNSAVTARNEPMALAATKEGFVTRLSRLGVSGLFTTRDRDQGGLPYPAMSERPRSARNQQQDFFHDSHFDRDHQPIRLSRGHTPAGSGDEFLIHLGATLQAEQARERDPFSDTHAVRRDQTPPRPLNPFSDTNSIMPLSPARKSSITYVTDLRRSRSQSTSSVKPPVPPKAATRPKYRTSSQNNIPFEVYRNKVRSDPFDLEIDNGSVPSTSFMEPMPLRVPKVASSVYSLPKPLSTYRRDSFTSKYSSGVSSLSGWDGGPGPSISHMVSRQSSRNTTTAPVRNVSKSSKGSTGVGKAF